MSNPNQPVAAAARLLILRRGMNREIAETLDREEFILNVMKVRQTTHEEATRLDGRLLSLSLHPNGKSQQAYRAEYLRRFIHGDWTGYRGNVLNVHSRVAFRFRVTG